MRAMTARTCRGAETSARLPGGQRELRAARLYQRGTQSAIRFLANSPTSINLMHSTRRSLQICSAVGEASQGTPMVTIRIPYRVNFGETLRVRLSCDKVVGSSSLLGDWSADRGLQLTWTEGDVWTAEVPMGAGHYEFKCVVYNQTTNSVTRWEDGGNRILNITTEPGSWGVDCQWGATADMTQAFTPAPPPPAPAASEANQAAVAEEASSTQADSPTEELPTFLALSDEASDTSTAEDVAADAAAAAAAAAEASSLAAAEAAATDAGPSSSGGGGGAVLLLLATCAAGAVAAAAFLLPGGLDKSLLNGRASEAVSATLLQSSQVGAQVQSQLAALVGHVTAVQEQVAAVQPAVRAQMAGMQGSMNDRIAELQPMVRSGVSYAQTQSTALQGQTTAAAADAVATTGELTSRLVARQG